MRVHSGRFNKPASHKCVVGLGRQPSTRMASPPRPDTDKATSGVTGKAPSQQEFDKGGRVESQPLVRRVDGIERRAGRRQPGSNSTSAPLASSSAISNEPSLTRMRPCMRTRVVPALMLPAPTMAENVVRSWGSRQGNGQSPTVRA